MRQRKHSLWRFNLLFPLQQTVRICFLSPSFEATRTNIEKKEFSYILITLKDGQIKNCIVFEPSKPKAEVIATQFSRQQFGDEFIALAAKPRTQLREARVLFDEGKIIFPSGQQTVEERSTKVLPSVSIKANTESIETAADKIRELEQTTLQKFYKWAAGRPEFQDKTNLKNSKILNDWLKENAPEISQTSIENMWRSHLRIVKSVNRIQKRSNGSGIQPYSGIYKKLLKVIPDLIKHIDAGKHNGKSVKDPKGGLMDLHFDYLGKDKNGNYLIALSHYFRQNGDSIADPDMEIRILPKMEAAEAMTYQDQFGYQEVYPDKGDGKEYVNLKLKKSLNQFLNQWLTNIIAQGHTIDLTNADSEIEESETTDELSTALNKDPSADRSDYLYRVLNRYYTEDKEKEILTKFSALGFIRPFSAEDAVKQNLPVKDLAFRYTEPMIHFQNRIERPSEEKIRSIRDELKNLKSEKGINDKKTTLKEQIEELEREMNVSELVVRDELLIFQDDLFAIIFEQAKEKAKKQKMIADDLRNFREYIIDNLFDSRAAESYYSQPLNQVIKELIDE